MAVIPNVIDISFSHGVLSVKDGFAFTFRGYAMSEYSGHHFNKDGFRITIGLEIYECPISALRVQGVAPVDEEAAHIALSKVLSPCCGNNGAVGNAINGTFTTVDNQTVTVQNGLITLIEGNL